MSQFDKTDRSAYITLGILFGVAVGTIAGVLTAPRRGSETREQLRTKAKDMRDQAKEEVNSKRGMATRKLEKTIEKSKQMASEAADNTKSRINKAAESAKQATDKVDLTVQNIPKLDS